MWEKKLIYRKLGEWKENDKLDAGKRKGNGKSEEEKGKKAESQ